MLEAVVLAAGQGTRMASQQPKVLHSILGKPMIEYVLKALPEEVEKIWIVTGYKASEVESVVNHPKVSFVRQSPQKGTADAVKAALPNLSAKHVFVVSGDMPLVRKDTLDQMLSFHFSNALSLTFLVAELVHPQGYGRVLKEQEKIFIVEESELSAEQEKVSLANVGFYIFSKDILESALFELSPHYPKDEYYLTDVIGWASDRGYKVDMWKLKDPTEAIGVNTREDLAEAIEIMRNRKTQELMEKGVTLISPSTLYVEIDVEIESDTLIYPWVFLQGETSIGKGCTIYPGVRIVNSTLEDRVQIFDNSLIEEAYIEKEARIGPMAHLRPGTHIKEKASIGNFVEVKKSTIGKASKANHLSYIGDATVGDKVNIGAGTITCNYDGVKKHPTFIGDEAFIGSNCELVAPVSIGAFALIGAGTTVVKDVPENALALSRAPQTIIQKRGVKYFIAKKKQKCVE